MSSASDTTQRRRARVLYADRVVQQTTFDKGWKNHIKIEGGNYGGSAMTYDPHFYNMEDGTTETSSSELTSYVNSVRNRTPDAPTSVSAESDGLAAIVSFTAPLYQGQTPVTSYKVLSSPGSVVTTGSSSPITVSGLTAGETYTFVVYALNSVGQGTGSSPSNAVTLGTTPDPPTNVTGVAGNTSVSVSYDAPLNTGGLPITGYTVYVYDEEGFVKTVSGVGLSITVTGLTNGVAYTFTCVASNELGDSDPSSESDPVTPLGTPSAPTSLAIVTNGGSYVTVSFTAPTSDGGAEITNYKYSTNNGTSYTELDPADTSSPITISGLTGGSTYTIRLRAVNSVGDGTASSSISVTAASVPGTPILQYVLPDDGALYVYFTAGSGGAPTNYEYSTDGEEYFAFSPASTTSPQRISPLSNGTSYTIRVRALNDVGTSADSNTLTGTPVAGSSATAWLYFDPSDSSSYSGSGNTVNNIGSYGALSGTKAAAVTYNSGIAGGVFDFNGANGSIISFGSFDFGTTITVAAWVYPRSKSDINGLLTNAGANVPTNGFKFQWNWWLGNPRAISFQAGNGLAGGDESSAQNIIIYDTWQHFAYVFDKTNQKVVFFLNGVPVTMTTDVTTVANINTNAAFNIGGYIGGFYTMNAQLGYLKVYNTLLDATQVYADYNASKSRFGL